MNEYTIDKKVNADGSITISLGGDFSIETSGELHKTLMESLDESPEIILNLGALESIDMTCMQVICSGCKTAAKMGREYECEADAMPECMVALGGNIGGPQGLVCSQNNNKPCIWYGGIKHA